MRILLVNTNREHLPDAVAPIGLAYVAGAATERGHEVSVADLSFAGAPQELLARRIHEVKPELVGLSIRNIDNAAFPQSVTYLPFVSDVVATVRAHTAAPVVLGGAAFSLLPEQFLARVGAEYGVVGEGEESFPRLLEALGGGGDVAAVPGVITREHGLDRFRPAAPIRNPAPAVMRGWAQLDVKEYWRRGGQLPVQTKRGCPFACAYCTYPELEGQRTRAREPGAVADEIERWVVDHGVNHFFFVDNVFNSPEEHAVTLLEEILRRGRAIGWTAYVSPRTSSPELAALMARSGCKGVEVGVDGGSGTTMHTLRKGFTVEHVRKYFADTHAAGIDNCCSLIFGGPGESHATVDETFALMDELAPKAVVAMLGVRTYPGSEMWPLALRSGQVHEGADPFEPAFYLSEQLSPEDIQSIFDRAAARSNWVMPGKQVGLDKDMLARLRSKNIKGPLWRLLRMRAAAGSRPA